MKLEQKYIKITKKELYSVKIIKEIRLKIM